MYKIIIETKQVDSLYEFDLLTEDIDKLIKIIREYCSMSEFLKFEDYEYN